MKDVVVVYREELGKVGRCAGGYSRGRGGCHYDCGKERRMGKGNGHYSGDPTPCCHVGCLLFSHVESLFPS